MTKISEIHIPVIRSTSRRLKRNYRPAIAFFYLLFLSFLFLTPAEYVNCQHIYPDECLDFFEIGVDLDLDVSLIARSLTPDMLALPDLWAQKWYATHTNTEAPCPFFEELFHSSFTESIFVSILRC